MAVINHSVHNLAGTTRKIVKWGPMALNDVGQPYDTKGQFLLSITSVKTGTPVGSSAVGNILGSNSDNAPGPAEGPIVKAFNPETSPGVTAIHQTRWIWPITSEALSEDTMFVYALLGSSTLEGK